MLLCVIALIYPLTNVMQFTEQERMGGTLALGSKSLETKKVSEQIGNTDNSIN